LTGAPDPAIGRRRTLAVTVVAALVALSGIGVVVLASFGGSAEVRADAPLDCRNVVPLEGRLVGFSPGSGFESGDDPEGDAAAMVATGARWIRLDLDWSWVERTRGEPDWAATDRVVDLAVRNGLRVLLLAAYTPEWARPRATTDKHPPQRLEDFAAFLTAAVLRYGDRVDAWELWNEPNLSWFWAPRPDPARFAALLRAGVAAIRAVDPDAVVVSGGVAPARDASDGTTRAPEAFLAEVAVAGGFDTIDAVGLHPYSAPVRPGAPEPWNLFSRLRSIRELVARTAGRPMPLWLTEYGLPTGDNPNSVSERTQAAGIVEAVTIAQRIEGVGPVFLYADRDRPDLAEAVDDGGGFGLRRADGRPRPSFGALRAVLRCPPA
jgi:hypothetical protein